MSTVGFEYKNRKNETPFETFLRYTDEKEKSAAKLATALRKKLGKGGSVLDIGTGNGEYLDLVLSKINDKVSGGVKLTLIEPSGDLAAQIEGRFAKRFASSDLKVIHASLQNFKSDDSFDVVLMSHLFYHLPRESWTKEFLKALSLLEKDGVLIIVLREKDDVYDFKMNFKPLLFDDSFKALTIDDVLEALPQELYLRVERQLAPSELHIPIETNLEDTVSIVEFFLNKEWHDIPPRIQKASLKFIKKKNGVFKQVDGIAVVRQVG